MPSGPPFSFRNFLIRARCRTIRDCHLFPFHWDRNRYFPAYTLLPRYWRHVQFTLCYPLCLSFFTISVEMEVRVEVTVEDPDFGKRFGTVEYRYNWSLIEWLGDAISHENHVVVERISAKGRPIPFEVFAIFVIGYFIYLIYCYFCWNHFTMFSQGKIHLDHLIPERGLLCRYMKRYAWLETYLDSELKQVIR